MKLHQLVQTLDSQSSSVIVVTGQMAAGKNYICSQLQNYGWNSVDADLLVHKAIEQANPQIIEKFQEPAKKYKLNIQNSDGSVNRRELGKLLFAEPELLKQQETIVYPIITQMVKDFISTNPKAIINATVLYKTPELLQLCKTIVFVKAPLLKRIIRAKKRDKLSLVQILRRFKSQKGLLNNYKISKLPIIIVNN